MTVTDERKALDRLSSAVRRLVGNVQTATTPPARPPAEEPKTNSKDRAKGG
jgi:hypothetical protein